MRKPKVRLVGFGEKAESTARSLILAGSLGGVLTAGCGPEAGAMDDGQGRSQEALNHAGSGVLGLAWGYGGQGFYPITSTVDEFTRAGQELKLQVPGWYAWDALYPGEALGSDAALKKFVITVQAHLQDKGAVQNVRTVRPNRVSGTSYELQFESRYFKLPSWTDGLGFTVEIRDGATGKSVTLGAAPDLLRGPAVFGGELPKRTAFFDNTPQGELRERVLEFGNPAKGSELALVFSESRADQIASRSELNTQIGTGTFSTRFGQQVGPIYGRLVYEVLYGHRFDQNAWQHETALTRTSQSPVLPGIVAYEGVLPLPADASNLEMYFHVRAWLEVDYSNQQVIQAWYTQGQRVLLKDAWDNPNGAGDNYTYPVE